MVAGHNAVYKINKPKIAQNCCNILPFVLFGEHKALWKFIDDLNLYIVFLRGFHAKVRRILWEHAVSHEKKIKTEVRTDLRDEQ